MNIVAWTPLILGILGLWLKTRTNGKKLDTITVLVNGRLEQALKHIERLEEALELYGNKEIVEEIKDENSGP